MKKSFRIVGLLLLATASSLTFYKYKNSKDFCHNIEKSKRDACQNDTTQLLQESKSKSSTLEDINVSLYKTDLMFFKPRPDLPEWKLVFPIDWNADPFKDRNWRMSLNSGRPADNCMYMYGRTNKPEFFRCAFDIFKDWYEFNVVRDKSNKFGWYDMSAAFRADRISKLLDWASEKSLLSKEETKLLLELAYLHIEYLLNPKNLNPGNHGVFQLASLERICKVTPYILDCDRANQWIPKMNEILTKDQFGIDGLHLEHSPGYHFFMIRTYQDLIEEGVLPLTADSAALFNKAKDMRHWLVTPEDTLPSIGDTEYNSSSILREKNPDTSTFKLLPNDGLAIVREAKSRLWFYGFHHSRTHKHDDDLSFFLWDKGQPLFIDAGKFAYESDKKREYVLSRAAHNTAIIPGLSLSRSKFYGSAIKDLKKNGDRYFSEGSVQYENGISHKRQLDFHPEKSLKITDKFEGLQTVGINFLLSPKLEKIKTQGNMVIFQNKKTQLTIDTKTQGCKVHTYKGFEDDKGMQGWYSPDYKVLEPTWSVLFECPANQEIVTEISY